MQQQLSILLSTYQNLGQRDRLAVNTLAIFSVSLFIIYGLIMPAINFHSEARNLFKQEQEMVQWLKSLAPAIEQLDTEIKATPSSQGNTLSAVNNSAKQFKLTIKRVQPENSGDLRVWMEDINFNNALKWLHHLSQTGITTKDITLERTSEGSVNLRATFSS